MLDRRIHLFVLVVALGLSGVVDCRSQGDVGEMIEHGYLAILEASESDGDVSTLVPLLNEIIEEVASGSYDSGMVESRLGELMASAETAGSLGVESRESQIMVAGAQVLVAVALSFLTWRYFPGFFWGLWLRYRGDWMVKD